MTAPPPIPPRPAEPAPPDPAPATDELERPAGLFGAAAPGGFSPVPVVHINGVPVASGLSADWDPFAPDRIVIDGVSVTWGREAVLDTPELATGRLQLFSLSGTWATTQDLRGQTVDLFWTGTDPATGLTATFAYFRGRVGSPVRVSRKTITTAAGATITGSVVDLPLVSILVDAANRKPIPGWAAETLGNRRARVAAALAAELPGGLETREYWHTPNVAPIEADQQISLYDHLVALYESSGADQYTYIPHERRVTFMERRDYANARGNGRLWWNQPTDVEPTARSGQGVYVRATGNTALYHYLDSAALEYPEDDGLTSPDRITTVRVTHPDASNGYTSRTTELAVPGTDEVRDGVRAATRDSIIGWDAWADLAADDLKELVSHEGAQWRLEPITWRTRKSGGFDSFAQAHDLLVGGETHVLFFLQRSFLPFYGIKPVFGIMGQTITYADGGWELECQVAPITTTVAQHPITWEEMDDGSYGYEIRWHDGDHARGMHESLTYEDLGWVSRGLGTDATTATGPDQGWDFLP